MLPEADSEKAVFERIVMNDKPYVFKIPTMPRYMQSIKKDYEFCRDIKADNNNVFPNGLVYYEALSIQNSEDCTVTGSISEPYTMSLNLMFPRPVSADFLCNMVKRVAATLTEVHALAMPSMI